jgi:hypothetical protein
MILPQEQMNSGSSQASDSVNKNSSMHNMGFHPKCGGVAPAVDIYKKNDDE